MRVTVVNGIGQNLVGLNRRKNRSKEGNGQCFMGGKNANFAALQSKNFPIASPRRSFSRPDARTKQGKTFENSAAARQTQAA